MAIGLGKPFKDRNRIMAVLRFVKKPLNNKLNKVINEQHDLLKIFPIRRLKGGRADASANAEPEDKGAGWPLRMQSRSHPRPWHLRHSNRARSQPTTVLHWRSAHYGLGKLWIMAKKEICFVFLKIKEKRKLPINSTIIILLYTHLLRIKILMRIIIILKIKMQENSTLSHRGNFKEPGVKVLKDWCF